jgi:hypothetical protein
LTTEEIDALNNIDFVWKPYHNFKERLIQLVDYKAKNGDCNVPRKFKGCTGLGKWVSDMRQKYKNNLLTTEEIDALNNIDFVWDNFKERLRQLVDYKTKNGDCNVTQNSLRSWVSYLRHRYKNDLLTTEQIDALNNIDFVWKPNHTFKERLRQLVDYKTTNGDCNVPLKSKGYTGLGRWVVHTRHKYKKNLLTTEQIDALNNIGFV